MLSTPPVKLVDLLELPDFPDLFRGLSARVVLQHINTPLPWSADGLRKLHLLLESGNRNTRDSLASLRLFFDDGSSIRDVIPSARCLDNTSTAPPAWRVVVVAKDYDSVNALEKAGFVPAPARVAAVAMQEMHMKNIETWGRAQVKTREGHRVELLEKRILFRECSLRDIDPPDFFELTPQ